MKMSWKTLAKHLEVECHRLEGVELDLPTMAFARPYRDWIEDAKSRERQSRPIVDAAIRIFVRDGHWPTLSQDDRFFLHKRLYYGGLLADNLVLRDLESSRTFFANLPPQDELQRFCEWLLIDLWPSLGMPLWLETMVHYYNGCAALGEVPHGCQAALTKSDPLTGACLN